MSIVNNLDIKRFLLHATVISSSSDTSSSKSRLQHRDGQVGWHSSESKHMLGQTVNEWNLTEVKINHVISLQA